MNFNYEFKVKTSHFTKTKFEKKEKRKKGFRIHVHTIVNPHYIKKNYRVMQ